MGPSIRLYDTQPLCAVAMRQRIPAVILFFIFQCKKMVIFDKHFCTSPASGLRGTLFLFIILYIIAFFLYITSNTMVLYCYLGYKSMILLLYFLSIICYILGKDLVDFYQNVFWSLSLCCILRGNPDWFSLIFHSSEIPVFISFFFWKFVLYV